MNRLSTLQSWMLRSAGTLLSSGRGGAVLILIYHRVLAQPDPLLPDEPDAAAFAAHLDVLRDAFNVLPFAEAAQRLQAHRPLPPRAACITFDDGYANNHDVALPLLVERNLPATFFVSSGFTAGDCMWNDQVTEAVRGAHGALDLKDMGLDRYALDDAQSRYRAISALLPRLKHLEPAQRQQTVDAIVTRAGIAPPRNLMMSPEKLRGLAAKGMEIGAHTVHHPILQKLDEARARREIAESRQRLQDIVGQPVVSFAYPNGRPHQDYGRAHVEMAREAGYAQAVSTAWGCAVGGADPFQLPRVAPWDKTALRFAGRLMRSYRQRSPAVV